MKKIALMALLIASLFGSEPATKDDMQALRGEIKEMKSDIQREMDKRFEAVQQQMQTTNDYILGVILGIFGLIGFMMWDRRTVVEKAKKETEQSVEKIIEMRLEKKADKALLEKILEIIERLAKDDKETQELLKKHRMSFV